MGLFDTIKKEALGRLEGKNPLLDIALGLINNPNTGGLSGLVENFKSKGLGDAVSSWIGTGENQPVSGDQVEHAIGSERVEQIAQKLGMPKEKVSSGLASLLPQIIDRLTPHGQVPEGDSVEQGISGIKKSAEAQS